MEPLVKKFFTRILCLLGMAHAFVYIPWQLAFQLQFDRNGIIFDFLTSGIVLSAVILEGKNSKSYLDWLKIILLLAPYGALGGVLGFDKPLIYALGFLKALPCLSQLSDSHFLMIFPKKRRNYELIMILFLIFGLIHTFACIWISLNGRDGDLWTVYNKAIYWTVTTVATVGYGDITPSTNTGRVFAIGVMLFGVAFYGFIVSKISTFLFQKDRRSEIRDSKISHLGAFLDHYKIPAKLQNEVFGFYEHRIQEQTNDEEIRIISELPEKLRLEIQIYLNIAPLSKTHLFTNCSEDCLKEAATLLEKKIYEPHEKIIVKGEVGHEMYIIAHGKVRVSIANEVIASLQKGQSFGEVALISASPRSADVVAESYCDLYVLTKDRFDILTKKYPDLQENVLKSVKNRKK